MELKNNINFILKIMIIIFVIFSLIIIIYFYNDYKVRENLTIEYFHTNSTLNETKTTKEPYLGILEIPRINLKKGFFPIESKNNNVKYNIQIIKNSTLPDINNNILVLASHSGNGIYSYFNHLDKLTLNDSLYIYYNGNKYDYKITNIYKEEKNGHLSISKLNISQLILTTCDKLDKTKQLVIESQLKEIETY